MNVNINVNVNEEKGMFPLNLDQKINQEESVEGLINSLFPLNPGSLESRKKEWNRIDICCALEKISPDKREDVIHHAKVLMEKIDSGLLSPKIEKIMDLFLKGVAIIDPKDREGVINQVFSLSILNTHLYSIDSIFEAINDIKPADRQDVVDHFNSLLENVGKTPRLHSIIKVIADIDPKDRKEVIENAKDLIPHFILTNDKIEIIKAVAKIKSDRKMVMQKLKSVIQLGAMNSSQIKRMISAVDTIFYEDNSKGEITDNALCLTKGGIWKISGTEEASIFEAIANVKSEDREDVLKRVQEFVTSKKFTQEKIAMTKAMANIERNRRESFIEKVNALTLPNMSEYERVGVINKVAKTFCNDEGKENTIENSSHLI